MESFHPGTKSFVFALLCAFLTTKNGRQLGARILNKHIKLRIFFLLPVKVRCKIVEHIMSSPIPTGRKLMATTTKPWGEQYDYITKADKGNFVGHWIVSPEEKLTGKLKEIETTVSAQTDLVLYYIHGGGFRFGDSIMYMESFIHIINYLKKSKGINVKIFSVEYKLMPEVNYSATKKDCIDAYRYLTKQLNISPNKIILAGDSAGGNLVAGCVQTIRDEFKHELSLPLGQVMISPWISIGSNSKLNPKDKYIDCLTYDMLNKNQTQSIEYFNTTDLKEATISPLFGTFKGIGPTLVTYGGTEIFQHDVKQLIEKLHQEGVNTTVITRPAPHIWLICSFLSPTHAIWEEDCTKLADWCYSIL